MMLGSTYMCAIALLLCMLAITVNGFRGMRANSRVMGYKSRTDFSKAETSLYAASKEKTGLNYDDALNALNGTDVRVGIIKARWNSDIIDGLYEGVNKSLTECGVQGSNVFTTTVPGAFELPVTAKLLAASKRVDVIICLGCLIKGDTMHFEYIADATAHGIMRVSLDTSLPVLFGVLTVTDKEQAIKRSSGAGNEGAHWGKSAVEMGLNRMSALGFLGGMNKKGPKLSGLPTTYEGFGEEKEEKKGEGKPKKIGF